MGCWHLHTKEMYTKKIYTIHHIFFQRITELISWASRTTKMPNCIISFSDKNRRRGSLGDTTTNVSFVLTFLTIAFVHCEGFKSLKVPGKYYSFRLHRSSFLTSCGCPFKKYSVGIYLFDVSFIGAWKLQILKFSLL